MPSQADLETALRNADAADDTAAAQKIAAELQKMRGAQTQATQNPTRVAPGMSEDFWFGVPGGGGTGTGKTDAKAGLSPTDYGPIGPGVEAILGAFRRAGSAAGTAIVESTGPYTPPPGVKAALATVADVGISNAVPTGGGGAAGAAKVAPKIKQGAEWMMQHAIRPLRQDVLSGKAAVAIQTMLDKGYSASKAGLREMRDRADELNDQIQQIISLQKTSVNLDKVKTALQRSVNKFKDRIDMQASMADIKKAWDEFVNHPLFQGRQTVPVQQAQRTKQAISRELDESKYDPSKRVSAEVSAKKDIQAGLREEIGRAVPAVRPLNAEETRLLQTLSVVEKRVIAEGMKNPLGLAAFMVSRPAEFLTFIADRNTAFKSLLANIMYRQARAVGGGSGATLGLAASMIQSPDQPASMRKPGNANQLLGIAQ